MNPLKIVRAEIVDLRHRLGILEQSEKLLATIYEYQEKAEPTVPESNIDLSEVGMTKAIETVLATSPGVPFTPTAVRDALVARKFALPADNPMAPIHQALKRLAVRKESGVSSVDFNNQTAYVYGAITTLSGVAETLAANPIAAYAIEYGSEFKAQMEEVQKVQQKIQEDVRKQLEASERTFAQQHAAIARVAVQPRTQHVGSGIKPKG